MANTLHEQKGFTSKECWIGGKQPAEYVGVEFYSLAREVFLWCSILRQFSHLCVRSYSPHEPMCSWWLIKCSVCVANLFAPTLAQLLFGP